MQKRYRKATTGTKKHKTNPFLSLRWCFGGIYLAIVSFRGTIPARVSGTHYKQPAVRETSIAPVYVEATPLAVWIMKAGMHEKR